jgi:hypothetical protein
MCSCNTGQQAVRHGTKSTVRAASRSLLVLQVEHHLEKPQFASMSVVLLAALWLFAQVVLTTTSTVALIRGVHSTIWVAKSSSR